MPEVPKDPRQLARDILSGKVSIEDLAREQQRRREAATAGKKPLPRAPLAVQPPVAPQRPIPLQRPLAPRPPIKPIPRGRPTQTAFPANPFPQQRRPVPPARGPQIDNRQPPPIAQPPRPSLAPQQQEPQPYAAPAAIQDERKTPLTNPRLNIKKIVRNRTALRQSLLMAEVLGKPLALREDW